MESFKGKLFSFFIAFTIIMLTACHSNDTSSNGNQQEYSNVDEIYVVTTIAQIAEPLSVIGGDRLYVESLMGPSIDPHVYNATQSDIEKIQNADLIFYNGLELEANMIEIFEKLSHSKPAVAVGESIPKDQLLTDEDGALDPHIWFDIDLWKEALDRAVEELKAYSPDDADFFEENKQQYFSELDGLKEEAEKLKEIPEAQRYLVTAHDAFGYFGRMHDIEVVGLQGLSTEDEIGVSDINETIALIEQYQVPAIFVESTINPNSIEAVLEGAKEKGLDVEIGGELYSDAMGDPGTEEGTYIGMYRYNVNTIYEALTGGGNN